jgi:hypothetical protein
MVFLDAKCVTEFSEVTFDVFQLGGEYGPWVGWASKIRGLGGGALPYI